MADRLMHKSQCAPAALLAGSFALAVAALLVSPGAQAQAGFADPTRPPAGISASSAEADEPMGNALQSVLIPKKGKPVAIIGGQAYRLGERVGENRLIRLTEKEAVLKGPGGIERLQLTPGIEKTRLTDKKLNNAPVAKPAVRGSQP